MKTKKSNLKISDVTSQSVGQGWVYSNTVKDHFYIADVSALELSRTDEKGESIFAALFCRDGLYWGFGLVKSASSLHFASSGH